MIIDKETGEVVGERKISEIPGDTKPSNNSKAAIIVIASACLLLVICLIWISSVLSRSPSPVQDPLTLSSEPEPTSEPTPAPTPVPTSAPTPSPTPSPKPTPAPTPVLLPKFVRNGEILQEPISEMLAPLTVKVPDDENYCIVLRPIIYTSKKTVGLTLEEFMEDARKRTAQKENTMAFYVSAGKTAEVLVPLGDYEIYYATGHAWYGLEEKFGEDTRFYKCDDTFDFYDDGESYIGWTLTLYTVSNGNMDTEEINEGDFPSF